MLRRVAECLLTAFIAAVLLGLFFGIVMPDAPPWFGWIVLALAIAIGICGERRSHQKRLRQMRAKAGLECPTCGYDIRANSTRCPECGEMIPLPLEAPDQRR